MLTTHTCLGKALVIAAYLWLNLGLNVTNKWLLSFFGFKFPLFLTMAHMAFSFVALLPVMLSKAFKNKHKPTLQHQWLGVLAVGTLFAVSIGSNNTSLLSISLSLNQVIRSSIPVVTMVAAFFIEMKQPTWQEFCSVCILVTGVALAVWEGANTSSSAFGLLVCISGTVSSGLMMSLSGKLMSEKIDVMRLMFYQAPVVIMVLLPFYVAMEASQLAIYREAQASNRAYSGLVLLTCINALAYNAVHLLMIKVTSSVTTTVVGKFNVVLILVFSSILLQEADIWTLKMLFGCSLAVIGGSWYSYRKLMDSQNRQPTLAKDVAHSQPSKHAPVLSNAQVESHVHYLTVLPTSHASCSAMVATATSWTSVPAGN